MLRNFIQGTQSLLFPAACTACHQPLEEPENPLCTSCLADLPLLPPTVCRSCALPLPAAGNGAALCLACRVRPPAYDRVISPFLYEGPAKALVTALKYGGRMPTARFLGKRMACAVRERLVLETPPQAVLPVPLHPVRQRERTFNQAALLARAVASELKLPFRDDAILRRRLTRPQTQLTREERARNLRDAFAWIGPETSDSSILLVDDVLTTGATAGACARLLKRSGIRHVAVVTACRG